MDTVVVAAVQPYTPGDESASVTLRSKKGEVVAFCFPCDLKVGDTVPNRLSVLDGEVRAAYLSDWPTETKEVLSSEMLERIGEYAYRGRGRVIDRTEGLVEILGFIVDFGDIPCDGTVEFEITRLDLHPS